jgi:type VI secretion system protein ImpE
MSPEALLKAGDLEGALSALQAQVKADPGNSKLRIFLFQLLAVLGQWERAGTQLQVLGGLSDETALFSKIFGPVILCERLRSEVFEGKRTPIFFGEPQEWMSLLVHALELEAAGKGDAARELRDKAFEAAPATPGARGETAFDWIADADPRLGPMLEVYLNGRYFWVPFCLIRKLHVEAPSDLRDLVWAPAQFLWANGGEASGFIPVRYPGTESSADGSLRLCRRTDWVPSPGGLEVPMGQRVIATSESEHPLLELGSVQLNSE